MTTNTGVTRGSGNIFEDLGFDNPDEEAVKARLVMTIRDLITAAGLSQAVAGERIGLAQPDVSKLFRGRVGGFSLERLFGIIRALGSDITISVTPGGSGGEGRMLLEVA